ncbi:MAG: hypothetical protein NXH85_09605 [Pseudomonadaceae bacterium]|nr:hypothetical protein [Pseudomonadaceae bacterium]
MTTICSAQQAREWLPRYWGLTRFPALLLIAVSTLAACEQNGAESTTQTQRLNSTTESSARIHELPSALREVSGLALSDTGALFAIADEVGRILELDATTGAALRQIDIGRPPVKGDFEGLAIDGNIISAVTSDGVLYQVDIGSQPGELIQVIDLDTRDHCEIEGLSNADESGGLWLVCKRTLGDGDDNSVRFLRWDPALANEHPVQFDIANRPILDALDKKDFNPSAIAITQDRRGFLVIAARQKSFAFFQLTDSPRYIRAGRLIDAPLHAQAEGLAIDKSEALFIANEGAIGRLFAYPAGVWSHMLKQQDNRQ